MSNMKVKFLITLLFIIVSIVLPLSGHLTLLYSFKIGILILSVTIILLSQPAITLSATLRQQKRDKFSVLVIMAACAFCINVNVFEWAYFKEKDHHFLFSTWTILGCLLLFAGIIIRIWAIKVLGNYFTSVVQVQEAQKIIQTGPYRLIRHPSYLGAYLAIIGTSFLLHTQIGMLLSAAIMLVAYMYRIKLEEQTLVKEFGTVYRQYQEKTCRLIPFIY